MEEQDKPLNPITAKLTGAVIDRLLSRIEVLEEENERLRHHEAWTIGLWATDRPELFNTTVYVEDDEGLPKKVSMFEITRTPSNKEVQ